MIGYAVFILSIRVALLFIAMVGFVVAGFICWHEVKFHGANGITIGMRNLSFSLGFTFLTFLVVSLANLMDLANQRVILFAITNTLTVLALASTIFFAIKLIQKMGEGSHSD